MLLELPVPFGQPDRVTISRADRSAGRRSYPNLRLLTSSIDTQDRTTEWGVPVLRAARTSLDVARAFGFPAGLVLADAALATSKADPAEFQRIAATMRRWSRAGDVDLVASHASGRRESPIESRSFAAFVTFGLPLPRCNPWVLGDQYSRGGVRADFVWDTYRLVGEADGRVKYVDPRRPRDTVLVEEKERQTPPRGAWVRRRAVVGGGDRASARRRHRPDRPTVADRELRLRCPSAPTGGPGA
jgi:hypothetical protein